MTAPVGVRAMATAARLIAAVVCKQPAQTGAEIGLRQRRPGQGEQRGVHWDPKRLRRSPNGNRLRTKRVSVPVSRWLGLRLAAMLILLSGCFQSSGPSGGASCGPAPTTQVDLNGATAISASDIWVVGLYQDQSPATAVDAPVGPWTFGAHLNAVASVGPRDVWAVGSGQNNGEEQTLIEHWDGGSWAIVASPNSSARTNELVAVDMISAKDAWAVGDYLGPVRDLALTEHWDGVSWTVVGAENPAAGINRFAGVSGINATDVWAVGFRRESDSMSPRTLIERWDGLHWTVVPSPSPGRTASLTNVHAVSVGDVWAVGTYDAGNTFLPLVEHWNGKSWTIKPSPEASNATAQVVAVRPPKDIWVAGASSQGHGDDWSIQHWDGARWIQTTPAPGATGVVNTMVINGDSIWAMGTYRTTACGPDWALIQRWDGKAWNYVPSPHDGRQA